MSNLIIVHQAYQDSAEKNSPEVKNETTRLTPVWQTCRRRLVFLDEQQFENYKANLQDEIYSDLDAEEFLVEVLCGLKSPLLGETEVFGQFKQWWGQLDNQDFKNKFEARIQQIYSVVKKIREESLYGLGSQSYGSLLRKKISELSSDNKVIDFIGAGQLVAEMLPWIEKKLSYRIWCRDPEKVLKTNSGLKAESVKKIDEAGALSQLLVIAAPLGHDELDSWIGQRQQSSSLTLFDFRHNSMSYYASDKYNSHYHLDHFTTEVETQKVQIQVHIQEAKNKISNWKQTEMSRAQVRPFGWDDL